MKGKCCQLFKVFSQKVRVLVRGMAMQNKQNKAQ